MASWRKGDNDSFGYSNPTDFETVDVGGVDPGAVDGDAALIDLEMIQSAVFKHRFAGGQGHSWW